MKHYILYTIALTSLTIPAMGQETYESANIATQDLNGTARYIGMGGAMEALGADISTISSNPAAIGLFRNSSINMTLGATGVSGDSKNASDVLNMKNNKMPVSFDQFGYVYSHETSNGNFLNFAINYHKSRNFNQILSAESKLNAASQNKPLFHKTDGYARNFNESTSSQNDLLYFNSLSREDGNQDDVFYNDAEHFYFSQNTKGYIGNYNFNLSGNHNDRIYWGFTFGIHNVNYSHSQTYSEDLVEYDNQNIARPAGIVSVVDERKIKGTGYDIKGGIIFRPIDANPLRIGLYISTPTWYELTSSNYTELYNEAYTTNDHNEEIPIGRINFLYNKDVANCSQEYDYKLFTPWKFGASIGHTIGTNIALGATYEYSDYSTLDNRNITSRIYYDYYDYSKTESESDETMNRHTEGTLKGVSTFKLGAEYRPIPELAIRAGYNYVSPMYDSKGSRTGLPGNSNFKTYDSDGYYNSSTTDYTNWKETNRFTLGVGFNIDNFNIDVAYMHSTQKGDFYPFETIKKMSNDDTNIAPSVEVNNTRNQFLITLGYKF